VSEQPPIEPGAGGDPAREAWGPGAPTAPPAGAAPWWSETAPPPAAPSPYSPGAPAPHPSVPGPTAAYPVTPGGQAWGGGWGGEWPPAQPPAARRTPSSRGVLRAATVAAVTAGLIGGGIGAGAVAVYQDHHPSRTAVAAPSTINQIKDTSASAPRPAGSVADVVRRVLPSVVTISERADSGTRGTGSGVVIDGKNGYILTNNHVIADVANGGTLTVLPNGASIAKALPATVKGADPASDLAVIKVDSTSLQSIDVGVSSDVVVGDTVLAIGAPLGLSGTVTEGIVSALNRTQSVGGETGGADTTLTGAIQTDAAINPGNSGGALINDKGRLIGINSAIASNSTTSGQAGNIGIGFAIPIDTALPIARQLISTGKASHPYIGVTTMGPAIAGDPVGARITSQSSDPPVMPGSPADKAGLKEDDVITAFDGAPVTGADDLLSDVRKHAVGDTVKLTVTRNGSPKDVTVTLAEKPS